MDISLWIAHRAEWSPHRTAIHFEARDLSYLELERRIAALAGALRDRLGVEPGARVAHLGLNSPDLLALLFACSRIGAIFVPLNWRLTPAEHAVMLGDCAPKVLIAEADYIDHVARIERDISGIELVALGTADVAGPWRPLEALTSAPRPLGPNAHCESNAPVEIVYTSGTTGRPKGAVLTQQGLFFNTLHALQIFDLTQHDTVAAHLPMFHVGGTNIMTLPALHVGGKVVMQRRFEPGALLRDIAAHHVTLLLAVPAVSQALLAHPDFAGANLSSLRQVCAGSSTVPEAVMRPWFARGIPVTQVYGLTESGPIATGIPIADAARKIGSGGRPVMYCQCKLADEAGKPVAPGARGEIWLRGPNLFAEYWRNPEATRAAFEDGWFKTGDIAHADADGYLYIDDRKKDVIISGGENIYPAELENVLADCADLAEFAVIGRADPKWVEVPVACVVAKPGRTLTKDGVLALFAGRLARYKHPRDVLFLDGPLPRTSLGKVQKFELRQRLAGKER